MNLNKLKTLLVVLPLFVLTGCGESKPQKGLNLWLKDINNYYADLGIKNAISVNYANYAYITGDGTQAAKTLKETVWYEISYKFSSSSSSMNAKTALFYDCTIGDFEELSSLSYYEDACYLIRVGALSGKVGTL